MLKDGFILREAAGAAAHRMPIKDPATGEAREVLMFGSNNYLGLANEPYVVEKTIEAIRKFGIGCGGPPLLNGTTSLHRTLEERLAEFKHCEAALIFSSGYAANVGWTTGLLSPKDILIYDAQSHASLSDGIKMGRFESAHFAHNDLNHLRRRLMQARWKHAYTNVIVCVEGVYSMDGDVAPLPEIRRLCSKYDALLCIDDAHGTGVLGAKGSGTAEHFQMEGQVDIVMGTFSKIFAVTGGFIAGSRELVDYLRFFSRSYMFSASLPPPVVASVLAGLEFLQAHPERVKQLHENVAYLVAGLRSIGYEINCETAIIPVFVPPSINIRRVVSRLHEEGVFVNGVEYPAVPKARQRLRLSVMATFTRKDLDFALDKLERVGREFGMLPARQ
ncbi:MAG: aminotransferase class I/II-fold pyridoxal phosphate-dependent enzyme [Deltaproteobacteria bacterium]|nr:aminotransferase class I/II-fold pyridoxal phosphate-dependent enzyme [Deltaproteobacteria bacterium]